MSKAKENLQSAGRTLIRFTAFIACYLSFYAYSSAEPDSSVDTSPAFIVGTNAVSHYAIEKNLRRAFPSSRSETIAPDAKADWFKVFLAKQVIIAEALADGYDRRPEVLQTVTTMERHMLSQGLRSPPAKPGLSEPIEDERLRRIYHQFEIVPQVVAVRLPKTEMTAWKGTEWSHITSEEKGKRLAGLERTAINFFRGPFRWPYLPFPEVESEMEAPLSPGTCVEHNTATTTTVVWIASVQSRRLPDLETSRDAFEDSVRRLLQQAAQLARRSSLLDGASLSFNRNLGEMITHSLALLPDETPELPREITEGFRTEELARYHRDDSVVIITVEDWRSFYNHQFVRRMPRTASALLENLKEMTAVDLEVLEARRRGTDQSAQFVEDRRNFLNFQVLDLYEKERILPNITLTQNELREYYSTHLDKFSEPVAAHCLALRFDTDESARDWLLQYRDSAETGVNAPAVRDRFDLQVSRDSNLPGLPHAAEILLHLPDHSPFGPIASGPGWIVILKRSTETKPLTYDSATSQVRVQLLRSRLDQEELRVSRELAKKFEITDSIAYSDFGVSPALAKPWK